MQKYINKVTKGDLVELFKNIPSNSVDVTFADPPFNLRKKYNGYKDSLEFEEYLKWCELWIKEMVRVTKPSGSIFIHNIPKWLTYFSSILNKHANFKHWISWDAPTSPMGKSLQPNHYGVLYYVKDIKQTKFYEIRSPHKRCRKCGYLLKDYGGKKNLLHPFGPLISDVWTDIHRIKHNKYRDDHPCQLPIHLLERIILMSSDENDVILDPFMGTGTTAIAAKRLGRNFIGFELDEKYVEIANQKIKTERFKSNIDDIWVSFFNKDIITIRDIDWNALSKFYYLPNQNKDIDKNQIVLIKNSKHFKKFLHHDLQKDDTLELNFCNCA
ncbi:MAG: DNA methyltransferase [Melioribacteraceae bacterium]|nr:DNA methyltransferase [Melioribacteraceae bacterium]